MAEGDDTTVSAPEEPEPAEHLNEETNEGESSLEDELQETQPSNITALEERAKLENLFRRMQKEPVALRVHNVIVKGNTKTKDSLIEAETALLKDVRTMQELLVASKTATFRLQALEIFDSVKITLDSGPPEIPHSANVIVEVVEASNPLSGEVGAYTKGEARSSTVEGSLKYKNLFGYGDLWDGSVAYGLDHMAEVSAGVFLPKLKGRRSPFSARVFLLSQDWLKLSSFKERSLGLSLSMFTSKNHDLSYNIAWRTLTNPSQMASRSVRRQLGHDLVSFLKYTFKIDTRNSSLRPMEGYAFVSTSQIGGIAPDRRSLKFLRQEFDIRYAFPFGFWGSAFNLGISAGLLFPWGYGFSKLPSPLPERYHMGGNLSPICAVGGPVAMWGFNARGLGPAEPRRQMRNPQSVGDEDPKRDSLGGDLAVSAFADLSFDLPSKWCRAKGVHGHIFACAGNVDKLTENAYQSFCLRDFMKSFRSCIGVGLVVPTNLFRLELNYCYILKKLDHDHGKAGFRISFSTS